jgi:UDP-N-acetylglucosamine acyltransferase
MPAKIHPTAVVDPSAELADGVKIGPLAIVGAEVTLGEDTEIRGGARLEGPSRLGRENVIYPGASLGTDPQDLKYSGERTFLEVGDRNRIREYCTLNRGTGHGGGVTRVGDDNLLMAYCHVAHDCQVGDRTVFANAATLAGHVEVHDDASISAFTSVLQFCRVGRHAYVGGYTVLIQDALPFAKTVGVKPACYGVNRIGLERKGVDRESVRRIDAALRVLLRSGLNMAQALEALRRDHAGHAEVDELIDFVATAKRGVVRHLPGKQGRRGGGER